MTTLQRRSSSRSTVTWPSALSWTHWRRRVTAARERRRERRLAPVLTEVRALRDQVATQAYLAEERSRQVVTLAQEVASLQSLVRSLGLQVPPPPDPEVPLLLRELLDRSQPPAETQVRALLASTPLPSSPSSGS